MQDDKQKNKWPETKSVKLVGNSYRKRCRCQIARSHPRYVNEKKMKSTSEFARTLKKGEDFEKENRTSAGIAQLLKPAYPLFPEKPEVDNVHSAEPQQGPTDKFGTLLLNL